MKGLIVPARTRVPRLVLLFYALAFAGGAIAYMPFLTFILPALVADLAGQGDIEWLGYISFAGALAASLGGVLFGWLSDITGNRLAWVAAGLVVVTAMLLATPLAESISSLLLGVALWQVALNMLLLPLTAWAGDVVPDEQKGLLGGLLAFAPALGAWSCITLPAAGVSLKMQLGLVAALTAIAIIPMLVLRVLTRSDGRGMTNSVADIASSSSARPALAMWMSRLLLQIPGSGLAAYFYFWLRALDPSMSGQAKATLFAAGLTIAIGVAVWVGRWTDLTARPFAALATLAAISAAGLMAMAMADNATVAKVAYLVFSVATAAFLAVHAGQTLRVLPRPDRRGRDLGLFNLTNTAPSLIVPMLIVPLVPGHGFNALLFLFAGMAAAAAVIMAKMPEPLSGKAA